MRMHASQSLFFIGPQTNSKGVLAGPLWAIFRTPARLKYDKANKIDALEAATY
ncbi:hypothetical protein AciX8_3324 [Granulicella mallensis MP5ACTX8]|uniref:Uncharacterized protein n=1 Tax=Granulicella mallensis (strain ATCC BAA-1857 / DSM 23137 / MP5ACTX8) TaxID=682795 RepID=G8NUT2_GRAMM|nr:hypothetical protein AciX8_3324 [Granulicella mallensis MP5ACTX8]